MPQERASVFEAPFLGVESLAAPGVEVDAIKQLEAIGFAMKPRFENKRFMPKGYKVDTIMTPGKEWTDWAIDGVGDFTNIVYPLSSILSFPSITTPGGGTNARDWTFTSYGSAPDLMQTYTVDVGSMVRAERALNIIFTEFGMKFTRDSIDISGAAIGKLIEDPVNLAGTTVYLLEKDSGTISGGTFNVDVETAGPVNDDVDIDWDATAAEVQLAIGGLSNVGHGNVLVTGGPLNDADFTVVFGNALFGDSVVVVLDDASLTGSTPVASETAVQAAVSTSRVVAIPMAAGDTSIYLDTTAGGIGTTQLTRVLEAELRIANKNAPLWVLDASEESWAATYEQAIDATLKVKMVADSVGFAQLSRIRNGDSVFVRLENIGTAFAAPDDALNRQILIDVAGKFETLDDFGMDGVTTLDWNVRLVDDATLGWIDVVVRNALTEL